VQLLTDAEATAWCSSLGLTVRSGVASERVQLPARVPLVRLDTKGSATALAGLAYTLLTTPSLPRDEAHFDGALVWLQRWELWSESIDRIGYALLGSLRGERPEGPELGQHPAHQFAPGEFLLANACLLLPLIFQWDAYLVPSSGRMVVYMSHEEHLDIRCARDEDRIELTERFSSWHPVEIGGSE